MSEASGSEIGNQQAAAFSLLWNSAVLILARAFCDSLGHDGAALRSPPFFLCFLYQASSHLCGLGFSPAFSMIHYACPYMHHGM